ncbi:MAG: glycosyltransferase family 2 protein [Gammaproteobacteria bacterium]|nr:glycosyltransferase family 2 protein [Gammaproteobacteria bacterium]
MNKKVNIAVLVPCYNEQLTVRQVIQDFRLALPDASIYIYDNNSKDNTVAIAKEAGAIVRKETLQGKGNVVRRMFADIEADIYILVDGDATYDAKSAPMLVDALLSNHVDMVNASRVSQSDLAYRSGHEFGNKLLTKMVSTIFGERLKDMLSGYRVFSRRFVKSFPILSAGFEIETELTVHALELKMPLIEIETPYYSRPEGSFSKLSTYKDGFKILNMINKLVKREKPVLYFGFIAGILAVLALILFAPIFSSYLSTGLVPRLPTAILSASLVILAFLSLGCGLILDTVTLGRKEAKLIAYLNIANTRTMVDD